MVYPTARPVTILIDGNDRTASIPIDGVAGMDAIGRQQNDLHFIIEDSSAFSLAIGQEVILHEPGNAATKYFGGVIARLESWAVGADLYQQVSCDDYSWHLDNPAALVSGFYNAMSDSDIIDDFMDAAAPDIDDTTDVGTVTADTVRVEFLNKTPREAIQYLADIGNAMWYVDYDKDLHFFVTTANDAPYDLSDDPNLSTTFGFKGMRRVEETPKANRVVVVGRHAAATATRTVGAEGDYGHWITRLLRDDNVFTVAQAQAVGDKFLAAAAEADTVTCTVIEPGLRSGMTIQATNSVLGYSATTFEIQSVQRDFQKAGKISYFLTLGKLLSAFGEQLVNSENVRAVEQYVTKKTGLFTQESTDDGALGARHELHSYNETLNYPSIIDLAKSHTAVVGTQVETLDDEELGLIWFRGVNSDGNRHLGGFIRIMQQRPAGATWVPSLLDLVVYDDAGNIAELEVDGPNMRVKINQQLHVEQDDAAAAVPVLVLDQADIDQAFLKIIGEAQSGELGLTLVNEDDVGSSTRIGWFQVDIEDTGNHITDGKYHVAFHTLSA